MYLFLYIDHIIRLPFDFMNTYKWQLFSTYHFFVTGVTFFSNIQSFYEILFLDFLLHM